MTAVMALRAAIHNLCSIPVKDLPSTAEYIATTISECSAILSVPANQGQSAGEPDRAVLLQKLKARITSLLQDKTVEGRWTGVILVKATVESGKWEILRGCESWVRHILAVLGKPDPLSLKKLGILCLTRIFQLTHAYPTLTREITTPTLPQFITACLNIISTQAGTDKRRTLKYGNSLTDTVLCSFLTLLPNHPTIFRPFSGQLHSLVLPLVASSNSANVIPQSTRWAAQQLLISLHNCAPKNTGNEEWTNAIRSTILSAHRTTDHLFRAVVEHWNSVDSTLRYGIDRRPSHAPIGNDGLDPLGLPAWTGIQQGSGRLVGLLELLSSFLKSKSNSTVSVPVGSILDLTCRLGSISPLSFSGEHGASINPEIGRDEREGLLSVIPAMYVAALGVLQSLLEVFGSENPSIARSCLEQTIWMFTSSNSVRSVREAAYKCFTTSLMILGPTLTKSDIASLAPALQASCSDLVPIKDSTTVTENTVPSGKGKTTSTGTTNADAFLQNKAKVLPENYTITEFGPLAESATRVLLTTLTYVQTEHIPLSLRAKIDRTSILSGNSDLMMTCVLNPIPMTESQRGHPSILPFLARSQPNNFRVEGLLRPRMPVIFTGVGRRGRTETEDHENYNEVETHGGDTESRPYPNVRESLAERFGPRPAPVSVENTTLPSDAEIGNKRRHQDDVDNAFPAGSPQFDKRPRIQHDTPTSSDALPSGQVAQALEVLSSSLGRSNDQDTLKTNVFPGPREIKHSAQNKPLEPSQPPTAIQGNEEVSATGADSDDEIPQLNIESDTDDDGGD
ncbi:hypothetical protein MGYG_03722 [Nannizzia gypsea CBS 118893]|uniref:Pre-rRNA-processing protein RIX1 n=1 Tax=Arthroderma gypseum (strain ATCC MYA-4604 / CBS 118893) TaxID=535722 RepID=E4UTK8_ARTGP|nr:hypothetical protein MGYG_03722 [Nannizzia gypsea CBS 118893]EFR00717.1 hypothetical protein MGYG_03722 [Nannizzia gypsea CBS 118893]